jgi:hypothetical protein
MRYAFNPEFTGLLPRTGKYDVIDVVRDIFTEFSIPGGKCSSRYCIHERTLGI